MERVFSKKSIHGSIEKEQVMQVTCSVCFMQFMVRIKLKVQDKKSGQCATHSVCITVGRGKVSVPPKVCMSHGVNCLFKRLDLSK